MESKHIPGLCRNCGRSIADCNPPKYIAVNVWNKEPYSVGSACCGAQLTDESIAFHGFQKIDNNNGTYTLVISTQSELPMRPVLFRSFYIA
jgi:hypothetical protein